MKPRPILYKAIASGVFSSRESVGWLIRSTPVSGARSQAILNAGSVFSVSMSCRRRACLQHDAILVAGRDHHHARAVHVGVGVRDQQRIAPVGDVFGDHAGDVEAPFDLAQGDQAAVGRQVACITLGCERFARDR